MSNVTASDLATMFVRKLRGTLLSQEWRAMLRDNATETNVNVCHSHDHCDANMVILDAYCELAGLSQDDSIDLDALTDLFNDAWSLAKPRLRA